MASIVFIARNSIGLFSNGFRKISARDKDKLA